MSLIHRSRNGLNGIGAKKYHPGPATLASMESLAIPLVQEVVILADFRCANCQKRVAEIMTKMNCENDSLVVDLFNKRVSLTCRIPTTPIKTHKFAPFKRLFISSCSS